MSSYTNAWVHIVFAVMQAYNTSNLTEPSLKEQISSGVLGFCFLLGVPGNILVIVMILRHFKRDSFTLHLMLNLAASDILCLLNVLPAIYNLLCGWHIGDALCKTSFFLIYLSVSVSLLTITLISVHRYVFVLHPEQWARLGRKGERALLLILWATACLLCGLLTTTFGVTRHGSREICWRIPMSDQRRVAVLLSEIVMNFIFPFSIMTACYCRLRKRVNQTPFFSNQRLTRLITSIVMTFLILWIPCHAISMLELFAFSVKSHNLVLYDKLQAIQRASRPVVKSFIFINSCVNPLLYAFNVRSLRGSGRGSSASPT